MKPSAMLALAAAIALVSCSKSDAKRCQLSGFEEDIPSCQRLCDKDDAEGCYHLGYLQMTYKHNAEADVAFKKACKLGNTESCAFAKK